MSEELNEAARRGLQRAAVHLVRAAIEVVEGLSAFLEEIARSERDEEDNPGPERIEVE